MTILIVDDNARMRSMIRGILAREDVECVECGDGGTAVINFTEVRPAWVVMDIMLTVMNGIKATQEIMLRDPEARVVIVTNFDDPEYREAAVHAGARAFILKEDLSRLKEVCLHRAT